MKKSIIQRLILICILFIFFSCQNSSGPVLHVYVWSDFIKPDLFDKFEKEHHCRIVIDTYDSNESMYAKLKLGATGYDLIFPSHYFLDLLIKQNMLKPLDFNLIPNIKNVDPSYSHYIPEANQRYAVPYLVSLAGLGFRKDKVSIEPSWGIFSNSNLKGRMTMLNDIRETLGAGLKYLGYSVNTIQPEEINRVTNLLIDWKKNLAKFESEQYKIGIASAEFLVVQGYNGDLLQVMQENTNIDFVYPKEGTALSLDLATIPLQAPNSELAHAFINFLLEGENAAQNIAYTFFLSPNIAAYDKLSPELRENQALFPSKEILSKTEVFKDLGPNNGLYIQAWDRIKAAD
jgi:spermidine/putrescine transport system substrate-binding protein